MYKNTPIDRSNQNGLAQQLIDIALKLQEQPAHTRRMATSKKKIYRRRIEQLWLAKYKRLS